MAKEIFTSIDEHFEHAIELQQKWKFEEAQKNYEAILEKDPENPDAYHNLGVLFSVQMLKPHDALSNFEMALNINPTKLQFWFSYLDALIKCGAVDVAEHVLILASNYGLSETQIEYFQREIKISRIDFREVVNQYLGDKDLDFVVANKYLPLEEFELKEPPLPMIEEILLAFNQGKFENVIKKCREAIENYPQSILIWKVVAEVEKQLGNKENKLHAYEKIFFLQPSEIAIGIALADMLIEAEKLSEAEEVLNKILSLEPKNAAALSTLGDLYQQRGDEAKALQLYAFSISINAKDPSTLQKLGTLLRTQGHEDDALVCFRQAVAASPESPELLDAYGVILRNLKRYAAAEDAFRSALKINKGYTPALKNLCHLLEFHGRFMEAEAGLKYVAEIEDGKPEAIFDVARNLFEQKRTKVSIEWLRRVIKIKPDHVHAHVLLSKALNETEEPSKVIKEIQASLNFLPDVPELHVNLGVVFLSLSKADEAICSFRKALEIRPNFPHARSSLLFALGHATNITAEELYREHRIYGKMIEESVAGKEYKKYSNSRFVDRPLKVGFVSADFRNHAVAQFVIPFFQSLAKYKEIITYAYANHGARDGATIEIERNINNWRTVVKWSDDILCEKIREDQIDILVDVSGHTAGNRLAVFARHPAPVQMTWLGYPGTTGLRSMDYRLMSSCFLLPESSIDLNKQFTENLIVVPPNYIFKKNSDHIDAGNAPLLKNGYITFGTFNRLNKISHQVVRAWSEVLKAFPDSKLIMGAMPSNGAPIEVIKWFEEEGIEVEKRINFYSRTGLDDYLKLHSKIDLCLDTFPYTGGTTTLHALWMGVPTLTIAGDTLQSRQSSAILYGVGLGELCVSKNKNEIVDLARYWINNPDLLNQWRRKLQAMHSNQDELVSSELAVKIMVKSLREIWKIWCRGEKPKSIRINYPG